MIITPVVSEKSMLSTEATNTYVFKVPRKANKIEIAKEIAARFKVTVDDVRTTVIKGKPKNQRVQGGSKMVRGVRSDIKKAYVTLKDGDSIELFEGAS